MAVTRKPQKASAYKVSRLSKSTSELLRNFIFLTCLLLLLSSFLTIFHASKALVASSEKHSSNKKIVITEFGWNTASVSQAIQADNLKVAYATFARTTYVKNAYWFSIQDIPEANPRLYFGLQTGGSASDNYLGVHKLSFSAYQELER